MPARLIINADDFGLTPGVNSTVESLHRAGVLTSATLMASGAAFNDAVEIAHRNPSLGVGCHIVLTDGTPVSPPASIPSLLGPDGRSFRSSLLSFVTAVVRRQLGPADILTEALAQIRKLQAAGIRVTHVDTHKHSHLFPAVSRPLLEAARQTGVQAIRNPFEQPWSLALGHGSTLRRAQVRLLRSFERRFNDNLREHSIQTTDGTLGISATGHLNATTLRQLLTHLPTTGTWELVCHPGRNDTSLDHITTRLRAHREVERDALLLILPQALSQPGAPSLIHYGELTEAGFPKSTVHIP